MSKKRTYWVRWIEDLIEKEQITAKPIRIEEVNNIIEVEPYNTSYRSIDISYTLSYTSKFDFFSKLMYNISVK